MKKNKSNYEINNNCSYKEYNLKKEKIIYNLRIEINKNYINFIVKELNSPLDYNYKVQLKLINIIVNLQISETDYSNFDLIFKKFDEIFENQNFLIKLNDNNMILNLIINNGNSNNCQNNKYKINLSKENMNYDDKINILYNQIKLLNYKNIDNNKQLDDNLEMKNIIKKIDKTNLNINKKEDDIKNIINEKDLKIKELNTKIEQIINENKKFIEDIKQKYINIQKSITNDINELKNEFENRLKNLYYIENDRIKYIREFNFKDDFTKIDFEKKIEKKDKTQKMYFGVLPENEIFNFFDNFKKALIKNNKINDKEYVKIKIKGTKEDIYFGSSIEIFNIDKANYSNYLDKELLPREALNILTITIYTKKEIKNRSEYLNIIEKLNSLHKKLDIPEKCEIYFRGKENSISINFVNYIGDFINQLFNIIDLNKYNEFKCLIKSECCLEDFFTLSFEELILKLFNAVVELNGDINNFIYILTSFIDALKKIKIENARKQQYLEDNVIQKLEYLKSFLSFSMDIEFDSKNILKTLPFFIDNYKINNNSYVTKFKNVLSSLIKNSGLICELFDIFKIFLFDEFCISLVFPKYKNGFAIIGKFPKLSKVLDDLV